MSRGKSARGGKELGSAQIRGNWLALEAERMGGSATFWETFKGPRGGDFLERDVAVACRGGTSRNPPEGPRGWEKEKDLV